MQVWRELGASGFNGGYIPICDALENEEASIRLIYFVPGSLSTLHTFELNLRLQRY